MGDTAAVPGVNRQDAIAVRRNCSDGILYLLGTTLQIDERWSLREEIILLFVML